MLWSSVPTPPEYYVTPPIGFQLVHSTTAFLNHSGRPLTADELRILNIVLVEYLDRLKGVGLQFEPAIADQAAAEQPVITKKRVVECLQKINQHKLAGILIKRHGKHKYSIHAQ